MSWEYSSGSSSDERGSERSDLMSLPALGGLAGGFILAYLMAEMALPTYLHPLHFVVAIAGAAVGYLVGLLHALVKTTL